MKMSITRTKILHLKGKVMLTEDLALYQTLKVIEQLLDFNDYIVWAPVNAVI